MPIIFFIEMLILAACWGLAFFFMRASGHEFGPISFIFMRTLLAALALSPAIFSKTVRQAIASYWLPITLVGLFNSAIPFVLFTYATLSLEAGFTSVLNATAPLFGGLLGAIWLKEALNGQKIIGIVLGFLGVVALVSLNGVAWGGYSVAIIAALLGSLFYGIAACYNKKHLANTPPLAIAVGSQWMSAVILLPAGLYFWPTTDISQTAWLHVSALGVISTALAFVMYFRLIHKIGPIKAISVAYLVPIFGVLWGMILLDEQFSIYQGLASALILIGVILTTGIKIPVQGLLRLFVKSN